LIRRWSQPATQFVFAAVYVQPGHLAGVCRKQFSSGVRARPMGQGGKRGPGNSLSSPVRFRPKTEVGPRSRSPTQRAPIGDGPVHRGAIPRERPSIVVAGGKEAPRTRICGRSFPTPCQRPPRAVFFGSCRALFRGWGQFGRHPRMLGVTQRKNDLGAAWRLVGGKCPPPPKRGVLMLPGVPETCFGGTATG